MQIYSKFVFHSIIYYLLFTCMLLECLYELLNDSAVVTSYYILTETLK